MKHTLFNSMTLACLACVLPAAAAAQECGPAMNCTITRPRPVVTTSFAPRQVTSFCDVTETQVCHKQVVENIPVTTCQNVTVDEGGYQMVWVPKPVTRQVAQTSVRQQVKTVSVPVQVTKRIPQVSTQMVPVQTVQYVNETVPVGPMAMAMALTCNTCGGGSAMNSQLFIPQARAYSAPIQASPYATAIPTMPAITVPSTRSAGGLAPSPQIPIPSSSVPSPYEETVPARGGLSPREELTVPPRQTSRFTGVPSAAAVWQRQNSMR